MAKIGAEGVLGVGLPDGRGLAVKVADGAMRALDPAGVELVRERSGLPPRRRRSRAWRVRSLVNSRGEQVGSGRADA